MYDREIILQPDKPNFPLTPVTVGVNSDARFKLTGVPAGCSARIYLTKIGATVAVYFDAVVDETTGVVTVFCAGANFPTAGTTGKYEILLTETETNHTFWAGAGLLTVFAASSGTVTAGFGNAMETYVYNPATRLYYKVSASINEETGEVTSVVDQTGVVTP